MTELKVGDIIRDNDPRTTRDRKLVVMSFGSQYVEARETPNGRNYILARKRIYTDDKPRRSGFSVVRP